MTKGEREKISDLQEYLADALEYLESGRIGEGVDWVRIASRLASALTKRQPEAS